MKGFALVALFTLIAAAPAAATPVGPGDVSGIWTAAGSPYVVAGHIRIPAGETLSIEPGVEIRFDGNYVLAVEGLIQAAGTAGDSILFVPHIAGTTWGHIEIPAGADGGSSFAYCRITGADARDNVGAYSTDGGGLMAGRFRGRHHQQLRHRLVRGRPWRRPLHRLRQRGGEQRYPPLSGPLRGGPRAGAVASTCKAARAC